MTAPNVPEDSRPGRDVRRNFDEVTFADLAAHVWAFCRAIWEQRWSVAKSWLAGSILGVVIAFGARTEYTASTKILPYRTSGTGSNLTGLAGLAGVRLPQGVGEQTITADLYPEVAGTLDFRVAVAETPIRFTDSRERVTPMKYFREIAQPTVGEYLLRYTVGLPALVWSSIRPPEAINPVPARDSEPDLKYYDSEYRSVLKELQGRLTTTADKKTLVITMTARMPDRLAAADLVRIASDHLMKRIIEYDSRKAAEQVLFLEEQVAAAKGRIDRVEREQAVLSDRSRGTLSATAQLEAQRLQREYSLAFDIYRQVASELEQARTKKTQDTPVFTVLEQVVVPDRRSRPRRGLIVLTLSCLGLVGGCAMVAARRALSPA